MEKRDLLAGALLAVAFVLFGGIYFSWLNERDVEAMKAAEAYERCVAAEYRTTPSAWYIEHGKYPHCDPRPYAQD